MSDSEIQPKNVYTDGEKLILSGVFWKKTVDVDDITSIEIAKTFSLIDELGITVSADAKYFFTDAIPSFSAVTKLLGMDAKVKEGWYARAEKGEHLVYRK